MCVVVVMVHVCRGGGGLHTLIQGRHAWLETQSPTAGLSKTWGPGPPMSTP
jgi:hypothetical protein